MTREPVLVAGSGGGGGKGGGGSASGPVEAPDTLRSVQYARVINVICEGEIDGVVGEARGVFCDDTPLQNPDGSWNFSGAGIEWRTGTAVQAPITGFSATESESTVGVTVSSAAPVTRTVTNPNLNAIRVTLGFPQLTSTDPTSGNMNGTTVQLAIDVQRNGAGFVNVYNDTVTGKTTARYQRSYRVMLSRFGAVGGTYDVRVRRLTPDSTTAFVVDAFQWETMTEIVDAQLTYPYSALVGVQIDASTFRNIPKLSFDVRMRRIQVPANYDPATRAYSGLWDGTFKIAWSDNPAWVLYDLATTERFGLGGYVTPAMVDKWTLYNIARYCDAPVPDGFGGNEPRYTCNVFMQERQDAITVLQSFATIFNAMLFWSGGVLSVAADMPTDAVMEYTHANVIDGVFTYVGTALNQRHTTALVTWNDPAAKFQQALEYVESDAEEIAQWGIRELQIQAVGCTSRGQAHRVGKWALLTEQMLSESVTFKSGINASFARPGDVFNTTDQTRAGARFGGRVLAANTTQVQLDAPVTFSGNAMYSLACILPDGSLEKRDIINPMAATDTVTLASAFSLAPARMGIWVVSSNIAQAEQWRCIGATEDETGNMEITGVSYRPDKYAAIEYGLKLEPLPTSIIDPFSIAPCTELTLTESAYQISPVVVGAMATFSWFAPVGAVRFAVSYQFQNDSPVYADAFMNSIDIQPTQPGMWYFTVWAINSLGIRSAPASLTVELVGLNKPPQDVLQFGLDIINDNANLTWKPATDLDVIVGGQTVVRFSTRLSTLVSWEEANEIVRFAGAQSSGFVALMKGTYFAKFENSSGYYSKNAAMVISSTGPLRDYNLIETMQQDPTFAGAKVNTEVLNTILRITRDAEGYAVATQGGYYFDHVIDMGKVYTVRCQSYVEGATYDYFNDVDTWEDWDAEPDVDGTKIDEGGAVVLASLTNVDPAKAADDDWGEYQRIVASDLTFRAARFACMLYVQDTTQGIGITDLGCYVDVPDRIESLNNTPIKAGGTVVTFEVPFKDTPAISIIAQDLHTGDKWVIDQQSPNGFRIAFHDSTGAAIAKTCDWIARGYGYEHVDLDGVGAAAIRKGALDATRKRTMRTLRRIAS